MLLIAPAAASLAQSLPVPIAVARADADGDFVPDLLGDTLTVYGRASVAAGVLSAEPYAAFIQDGSAGLQLVGLDRSRPIAAGDSVWATGVLRQHTGLAQLDVLSYRTAASPAPLPAPTRLTLADADLEHMEGRLVTTKGYAVVIDAAEAGAFLYLVDGEGSLTAFVFNDGTGTASFEDLRPGDYVELTGIVGQFDRSAPFDAAYQIYPRAAADVRQVGLAPRFYKRVLWGGLVVLLAVLLWVAALRRQIRRRMDELRHSEARYQDLFDHAGDPTCIHELGANGPELVAINQVAREQLGYTDDAVGTIDLFAAVTSGQRERLGRHLHELRTRGTALSELSLHARDGRLIDFEVRSHRFLWDGRPIALSMARDITERKAHEEGLVAARREAERLIELRSSFLANMSHEIRTPLAGIIGFAEVLRDEVDGDHEFFASMIEESGHRLLDTLNAVLDLARLDSGQVRPNVAAFDAIGEIRTAAMKLQPLTERKHIGLRVTSAMETHRFTSDVSYLQRIVANLVGNAIKFTEHGEVHVHVFPTEQGLGLSVRDTGVGISDAFLPYVFDEFNQEAAGLNRPYEGNGLGLAITKRLVTLLQGTIDVASRKGIGTTFTVRLPALAEPAERPADAPAQTATDA